MDENNAHKCSFCDKPHRSDVGMITGPSNLFICGECVVLCNDILRNKLPNYIIQRIAPLDNWRLSSLLGGANPEHITVGMVIDLYCLGEVALDEAFRLRRELQDLELEKSKLAKWQKETEEREHECRRSLERLGVSLEEKKKE